jgi:hypothetical protein
MKTKYNFNFRNKSKKFLKNQKGGNNFIDSDFLNCYEANLQKVMGAIKEYSGKHNIDISIAEEFIENQTSQIRRDAARNLISNTIYITLKEVYDIIGQLIDKVYSDFNSDETIYLYTGKPEKSSYFLCVIALKHIREKGYKEPIFIKELNNEIFDLIEKSPLIMLDDVSYSASQLSEQLKSIYYNRMYKKEPPNYPPNIYILLIALNTVSKKKLSEVPGSKRRSGKLYLDLTVSPFKLIYLEDRLYTPLICKIGIEKFIYLTLLFSPWLCICNGYTLGQPYVSLYLDNKIADPVSTFTTTLIYGQIPPSNIDFSYILQKLDEGGGFDTLYYLEPIEITRLLGELPGEFKKGNKVLPAPIINKFIELDKPDKPDKPSDEIEFKPFINACNKDVLLNEIIQDEHVKRLDYLIFMIPQDCFNNNDCSITYHPVEDYLQKKQYLIVEDDITTGMTESGSKVSEIHKKITSFKCPVSWYKKGKFQMSCTTSTGGRTRRRLKKMRKTKKNKK